jgi:hypothetical protein
MSAIQLADDFQFLPEHASDFLLVIGFEDHWLPTLISWLAVAALIGVVAFRIKRKRRKP